MCHKEWKMGTMVERNKPVSAANFFFFFEFLALNVSLTVLGRTLGSRRSIHLQYGCTQKLGGPEVVVTYSHNMC